MLLRNEPSKNRWLHCDHRVRIVRVLRQQRECTHDGDDVCFAAAATGFARRIETGDANARETDDPKNDVDAAKPLLIFNLPNGKTFHEGEES
jgi:hypothetical protein